MNEAKRIISKSEVITIVIIFLVLLAITIPTFQKYLKRSKTSEAMINIRKIFDGEAIYFNKDFSYTDEEGETQRGSHKFLYIDWTPELPAIKEKRIGGFNKHKKWKQIFFRENKAVYFSYAVTDGKVAERNIDPKAYSFAARAKADLDGDGNVSEMLRVGYKNENDEVAPYGGLYIFDEGE
ncbi:MAG: hypothetical protein ABIA04_04310 [Pseudomonadota bacterium]